MCGTYGFPAEPRTTRSRQSTSSSAGGRAVTPRWVLPFALGLLSGALLSVPPFPIPFGVAVLILAGLGGVALWALFWLVVLLPIVRGLACGL